MSFVPHIIGAGLAVAATQDATKNCKNRSMEQIFVRSIGDMAVAFAATTLNFISPALATRYVILAFAAKVTTNLIPGNTLYNLIGGIELLAKHTFVIYTLFCVTNPLFAGFMGFWFLGIITAKDKNQEENLTKNSY